MQEVFCDRPQAGSIPPALSGAWWDAPNGRKRTCEVIDMSENEAGRSSASAPDGPPPSASTSDSTRQAPEPGITSKLVGRVQQPQEPCSSEMHRGTAKKGHELESKAGTIVFTTFGATITMPAHTNAVRIDPTLVLSVCMQELDKPTRT